jgi:hypothetical protein
MNLGRNLSKMFGDYKKSETTVSRSTTNTDHFRSSTSNSYNKCIHELSTKFPSEIIEKALLSIIKHDQNDFDEYIDLTDGRILRIVGQYEFKWFAHCKSIEMWIEQQATLVYEAEKQLHLADTEHAELVKKIHLASEKAAAEQQRFIPEAVKPKKLEDELNAKQRAAELRAAELRAAELRAAELRAAEQRAAEQRAAEQRAAEQPSVEVSETVPDISSRRRALPAAVRDSVWNLYIGEDINKHRCLCCKKVLISNRNFQVGHVQSVRDGGTDEINNLRPICAPCNHSMSTQNMIEFVKTYGYYIG